MCKLTDNTYGIDFTSFRIRDYDSGFQLFEVAKDPNMPDIDPAMIPPEMEDQVRCISYDFGADFLDLQSIGTTCARSRLQLPGTLCSTRSRACTTVAAVVRPGARADGAPLAHCASAQADLLCRSEGGGELPHDRAPLLP